ncbi:unnamed protein product, partial [Didymodactylos carnosus]
MGWPGLVRGGSVPGRVIESGGSAGGDTSPKHYIILKNESKRLTSNSWETFGLPSKLEAD